MHESLNEALPEGDEPEEGAEAAPPPIPGPYVEVRTRTTKSGRPRGPHPAGGITWTQEWRSVRLSQFTREQLAHLHKEADRGMIELRFRDPEAHESIDAKAKEVGGEAAKRFRAARKALDEALADFNAKIEAHDAAVEEAATAKEAHGRLEMAFASDEAEWADVEAAEAAAKRAAARRRGAERHVTAAERAHLEAKCALLEAEVEVSRAAIDPKRIGEALDEALAPAVEHWPAILAALEDVAEVWRRYVSDVHTTNALAHELDGSPAMQLPGFPAGRVVERFAELAGDVPGLPIEVVRAAFRMDSSDGPPDRFAFLFEQEARRG